MGCVVARGPQKHPSAAPWGALHRRGVTQDTRPHLRMGHRLDLVDVGTRSRGRGGSTLRVFWNKLTKSLSKHRMPGLGVCGCSGASKTPLSCPLGSIVTSGGHRGHSATMLLSDTASGAGASASANTHPSSTTLPSTAYTGTSALPLHTRRTHAWLGGSESLVLSRPVPL